MGTVSKSIKRSNESAALPYLVAAIVTLAALGLRMLLDPVLRDQATYLTFLLAVLAASRFGGFRPGVLASVLSAFALDWFFIEPRSSLAISGSKEIGGLTLFCLGSLTISLVVGRLRQSLIAARNAGMSREEPPADLLEEGAVGASVVGAVKGMLSAKEFRRRPHRIWLGFAVFLVATEGALFYGTWTRFSGRERLSIQTRQVLEQIGSVLSVLQDAETGQQGYLLTGKAAYLQPYSDALGQISSRLDGLRSLTSDSPEQQKRIADLRVLVGAKLDELRETIELRRTAGAAAALATVQTDSGKNLMDQIREGIATLRAAELALLDERERSLSNAAWGMVVIMVSGIGLLLVVLVAGSRAIDGQIARRTKYEKDLREAEERFRVAQEFSPDGFAILRPVRDGEGRITDFAFLYQNPTFARRAGNEPNAVLGRTLSALYPGFRGSQFDGIYRQVADGGETRILEGHFDFGDFSPAWLRAAVVPMGQSIAVLTQDLTERREAEQTALASEKRYRTLFESMNEAVVLQEIVVDESRKPCDIHYLAVNPAFERHTGMKASEFVGHNASELFPGMVNEWLGRYEEMTRSDAPLRFEDWFAPLGRWLGSTLFPTEPGQFCHVLQDITERKRAEEALRESENRYRTLFSNMSEVVYYWNLVRDESGAIVNWRIVDANPAALRTWDKTLTEVQGRTPDEIFGAESTRRFMPVVQKIFREGVSHSHQGYFPALNRKFQFNSVPLGEYFLTTGGDITEREKADERLRASEEKFAKAFAANPAAVAIERLDGLVLDVNGAWEEMHGYSREEVVGRPAGELGIWPSPKERARFVADLKRDGLVPGREQLFFRKSGELFDALYSAVVVGVGGEEIVVSTLVDTTERKRAEASVRASRAKLEAALASMTDAVFISDAEGRFIEFNDAFATFHKFRSKEECARTFAEYPGILDVFFPDGTPAPVDMWAVPRALRGETVTNAEYGLRRKDTGETWIGGYSFAPIRDAGGAVVGSVVVGRDITEWKRTEEALRLTQASVDGAADMVAWFTPDGKVHYANDATCRTLQYSREELLRMTALDFSPGFTWEQYQEHWAEVRNRKSFTLEATHRRKDGTEYPAEILVNHVVYGGQEYLFAYGRDITGRKRAEERLRASEEKFAKAFAVNSAAVAMTRVKDGLFMDVNAAWEAMNGYRRDEVAGRLVKHFRMWPEPEDRDRFTAELKQNGAIQGREQTFLKKSGEPYTALYSSVVMNIGGEEVVLTTLLDATEQKKAAEALRQLNQQLEQRVEERTGQLVEAGEKLRAERQRFLDMLDTLPVIVAIIRQDYRVEWTNRAYRQALGDNAGQLCYAGQFGSNEPCEECQAFVPLETGQPHNWEWTLPDGRTFDIYNFPFAAKDGTPAVLEMDLDITERRRTEEVLRDLNATLEQRVAARTAELQASEDQFRTLANAIPQLCWTAKADGSIDWYNERWYQYTGMTAQDAEGWGWQSVHDPETLPAVMERWRKSLATGEPFDMVFPIRGGDGVFRPFLTRVMPLLDGDGKGVRWFGTNTDITAQRRAEDALRTQADLLRLSFDAIVVWRLDGGIESWNVGAEELYGYPESEAVGQELHDLLATVFPAPWPGIRAELVAKGSWDGELRHRTRDGEEVIISARKQLFRDASGVARVLETNRDITQQKKAQEALLTSNLRFRSIFENSAAGIILTDWEGRLLESNEAFRALLGYRRDELGGRHFSTLIPPADQEVTLADVRRLKSGEIQHFQNESRYLRKDGQTVWVHKFVSLIPDTTGKKSHVVALVTDITERKRAEAALAESEHRYRGLFESMQEAFMLGEVIFDEAGKPCDWRYLDVNPYFEVIYGRKREEVVGNTYRRVLPGAHSDGWIEIAGRVTLTGKGETFASKSNAGLYLEGTVYCPHPGQFAAIVTDATARREAEEQILRLNADLEDRVRDRTAQLEAANKELEAFAYSVSHDLRSPLRGIDGWSLALVEDYANQLDEQARQYLGRVRSEAQRMGLLIDDMLQLSRITRAQMEKKPVDLTAVATTVAKRLRESQFGRRIEFVIPAALTGKGDAGLLEIALTNLLGNAVKFTGQREDARIEFGTTEIDGERAFFVRDNGIGFNMASAGKLFGAFQRLHKASQFPGTGIGLATVQRIIHRHGGRVWADAERGKGATFYFTLDSK